MEIEDEESTSGGPLSEEKMAEILDAAYSDAGHYCVRNVLKERLSSSPKLIEKFLEALNISVRTKRFDEAETFIICLTYSNCPELVIGPILDAYDDQDWDYDIGYNQGENLYLMGVECIPYISRELHRKKRPRDWVGVLALGMFYIEGSGGGEEISKYLRTLSETDRDDVVSNSLLDGNPELWE